MRARAAAGSTGRGRWTGAWVISSGAVESAHSTMIYGRNGASVTRSIDARRAVFVQDAAVVIKRCDGTSYQPAARHRNPRLAAIVSPVTSLRYPCPVFREE